MKFKAIIVDPICMKDFYNIIVTFSKISKHTVCSINRNGMLFSNAGSAISLVPLVWARIGTHNFFGEFRMSGVSAEHDAIHLKFSPEQMSFALNVLKQPNVKSMKIKLADVEGVCLSVDIEMLPTATETSRLLTLHVPVILIPVNEWPDYELPEVPEFQISVQLPSLRSLRTLMDKMKNLTSTLTICTASNGDLSFIVETDYAMVVSKYYNLELEKGNENSQANGANDKLVEITCMVDSKQLAMCFASIQFSQIQMVGNVYQDDLFNISIKIRENVTMECNIVALGE